MSGSVALWNRNDRAFTRIEAVPSENDVTQTRCNVAGDRSGEGYGSLERDENGVAGETWQAGGEKLIRILG